MHEFLLECFLHRECDFACSIKSDRDCKFVPHTSQTYSVSLLCILEICLCINALLSKVSLQKEHFALLEEAGKCNGEAFAAAALNNNKFAELPCFAGVQGSFLTLILGHDPVSYLLRSPIWVNSLHTPICMCIFFSCCVLVCALSMHCRSLSSNCTHCT